MANLETLEIRVAANAESAAQGLSHLIGSLSSLSHAVGRSVGGMMRLNAELEKMKGYSRTKLPTIESMTSSKATQNVNASTRAIQKNFQARAEILKQFDNKGLENFNPNMYGPNPDWRPTSQQLADNQVKMHEMRMRDMVEYKQFQQSINKPVVPDYRPKATEAAGVGMLGKDALKTVEYEKVAQSSQKAAEGMINTATAMKAVKDAATTGTDSLKDVDSELKQKKPDADKASSGVKNLRKQLSAMDSVREPVKKTGTALSGLMTQVGRIMKTMLIRNALKALIKGAKEGLNNFYEYSKKVGTSYAASLDAMASKTGTVKNQIGAAIGTALAAITPILNAIASAAIFAANAITALFALLGGSSTWSKATASAEGFGKAVGGGGGAMKELLADFDELNVIASQGGGGGGGGAGDFGAMFSEMKFPQWLTDFMREWKPLINAVLAGVLGGILLPQIFKWLGKIFDLFGGQKIKNIIDLLKHWKDSPLSDLPDADDYNFPKQPDYKPFPTQPIYREFPEPKDYSGMNAKLLEVAGSAALATAAIEALQKAVEALQGVLGKVSIGLSIIDLIKSVAGPLLTALLSSIGSTIKIKVDLKEFEEFKKDFEKYKKENHDINLRVMFDSSWMDYAMRRDDINNWIEEQKTKMIGVMIDNSYMTYATIRDGINKWADSISTKKIGIMFDKTLVVFQVARILLDTWISQNPKKKIGILFDTTFAGFTAACVMVDEWVEKYVTKKIGIMFDSTFMTYTTARSAIDKWVENKPLKLIKVGFESKSHTDFLNIASAIDEWASTPITKVINIQVNGTEGLNQTPVQTNTEPEGLVPKLLYRLTGIKLNAAGAYDIPRGDVFIANEAGAELVGSINGKTSVANQGQIIEGIAGGVERANSEQNQLLREQNGLLRRILEKEMKINFGASAGFGRTVQRSLDMYGDMVGGR